MEVIIFRLSAVLKTPNVKFHNYGLIRHILRKCLKSKEKYVKKHLENSTHLIEEERVVNRHEEFDDLYHIYRNANEISRPVLIEITTNRHSIELKLDTGAFLIIIGTKTSEIIKNGLKEVKMTESNLKFKTYSRRNIKALGKA